MDARTFIDIGLRAARVFALTTAPRVIFVAPCLRVHEFAGCDENDKPIRNTVPLERFSFSGYEVQLGYSDKTNSLFVGLDIRQREVNT